MQPFDAITGTAVPLLVDDINTDQIAPVSHVLYPDYGAQLFRAQRVRPDGGEIADFVLNKKQFRQPAILVTGHNFGCGSSREGAVWGMLALGIRCVVARSFADTFRENCLQNGVLPAVLSAGLGAAFEAAVIATDGAAPFTADLRSQQLLCPDGRVMPFDILPADRMRLLEGLDDVGMTLKHAADIAGWEKRMSAERPWLQTLADSRGPS